jgi:hypothetical protein
VSDTAEHGVRYSRAWCPTYDLLLHLEPVPTATPATILPLHLQRACPYCHTYQNLSPVWLYGSHGHLSLSPCLPPSHGTLDQVRQPQLVLLISGIKGATAAP